ncbi:13706_t:CDS:2, partial [Acaulospora colombiana]
KKLTEPTSIYWSRFIVAVILFALIVAYFIIGVIDIMNEVPTIRLWSYQSLNIPVPYTSGGNLTRSVCADTFTWTIGDDVSTSGYFFPNSTQNFVFFPTQANSNVVLRVISGSNSSINSAETLTDLTISLYDQSLSPVHFVTTAPQEQGSPSNRTSFDQTFITSLDSLNVYTLEYNRVSSLPISDAEFDPTVYATIQITAQSFRTNVQQEIKDKTALTLLGLMGGPLAIAASLYYFLFGDAKMYPWGFIHNFGCCLSVSARKELRKHFERNAGDETFQPIMSSSQVQELDEINLVLRDYVVDMGFLDQSVKFKGKNAGDVKKGDL